MRSYNSSNDVTSTGSDPNSKGVGGPHLRTNLNEAPLPRIRWQISLASHHWASEPQLQEQIQALSFTNVEDLSKANELLASVLSLKDEIERYHEKISAR